MKHEKSMGVEGEGEEGGEHLKGGKEMNIDKEQIRNLWNSTLTLSLSSPNRGDGETSKRKISPRDDDYCSKTILISDSSTSMA